ncbi:MAG TPA: restriction endonuclease [Aggregatilineales bacterium]|nr:restriction endonuclease [Anaerolineales bacterium]HRE49654.1 restriction endonuclease [Aggregatilineales bacterium]
MAVPDFQSYMTPLLNLLSDGQEHKITDISEALVHHFQLTEDDLNDLIPSGRKSRHYDRVGWAATYMKQAGLLSSPSRAWYKITERGLGLVQSGTNINNDVLDQFPEFVNFKTRSRVSNSYQKANVVHSTNLSHVSLSPDETLELVSQELRNALAIDLLERLNQGSPQFFEQVVIDLLLAMGYGGSHRDAARRVGQSGDGGIDGIINEDRLGLDVVYIQAKRWQGNIGARELRDFVGSLDDKRTTKGVFITTSQFTREAQDYVARSSKRIVLIDGEELAQLMIDFNVGVAARKTYVIKRIDEDYFSEE